MLLLTRVCREFENENGNSHEAKALETRHKPFC